MFELGRNGKERRIQETVWTIVLCASAVVACFARLGEAPVYIANEAREGVYTRAMLGSGDFILPTVAHHVENDEVIPDKPPLFHWLAAAGTALRARLAGAEDGGDLAAVFDEWTLRFPSALTACLTVLGIAALGGRLVGARAARLAAAVLVTSWQFLFQAHYGRVDMTYSCFVTLAMLLLGRVLIGEAPGALVGAAGAAGLAVLAKGPIGVVLPLLAGSLYGLGAAARRGSTEFLRPLPWKRAIVVLLLVVSPWYAAALVKGGGGFVRSQLVNENFLQFTGGNGRNGAFYYLWPWFSDSLPWNLMAILAVWRAARMRHPGAAFCAVWWLAFLGFFEIAAFKRRAYLLPAVPAASLLAGWLLDGWLPRADGEAIRRALAELARSGRLALWVGGAAGAGALAAPLVVRIAPAAGPLSPVDGALTFGGVALAAFAGALALRAASERWLALGGVFAFLAALYVGVFPTGITITANLLSPKALARRIEAELSGGKDLTLVGISSDRSLPVLLYLRKPERVRVLADDPPRSYRPGLYLFSAEAWQREAKDRDGTWRELFRDQLRRWGEPMPVVFTERLGAAATDVVGRDG